MLTPYTQTVLPELGTDDDVPATLKRIFDNVDSRFVLYAASQADRDSRFGAAPAGVYVVCPSAKSAWLKLYDSVADVPSGETLWWTLGQDLGTLTNAFTVTSNLWQANGTSSQHLTVRNGFVDFSFQFNYIGTDRIDHFNGDTGDCPNSPVGQLSSAFVPVDFAGMSCSYAGGWGSFGVDGNGVLTLGAVQVGGGVKNGDGFSVQGTWALKVY